MTDQQNGWLAKPGLSIDQLNELVTLWKIDRNQIVAITEPEKGKFTLLFDPTPAQRTLKADEDAKFAETARNLYGKSIPIRYG